MATHYLEDCRLYFCWDRTIGASSLGGNGGSEDMAWGLDGSHMCDERTTIRRSLTRYTRGRGRGRRHKRRGHPVERCILDAVRRDARIRRAPDAIERRDQGIILT